MATSVAGSRVAHIPELLEKILLNLVSGDDVADIRTITRLRRVSASFRDTIDDSPWLVEPLSLRYPWKEDPNSSVQTIRLPTLRRLLSMPFGSIDFFMHEVSDTAYFMFNERYLEHPLPTKLHGYQPEGSWRRMYVANYPYKCKKVVIQHWTNVKGYIAVYWIAGRWACELEGADDNWREDTWDDHVGDRDEIESFCENPTIGELWDAVGCCVRKSRQDQEAALVGYVIPENLKIGSVEF